MFELRICRICLDTNVQMHQISGSKVQDVFEKLTKTQVQNDGSLYSVCYLCYWQLRKCQELVTKSRKTEELLKQILVIHTELNLKSIHSVDRLSYGLVHSLKISKTESFQMPECCEHNIKSKDQTASHTYEVMIKDEPEDDWTNTTEELHGPDGKQIFIQDKAKCMENIDGSQKNTFAEVNASSNIVNSLMIIKTESLKIPECNENIESDEPRQSNYHEFMMKVEPEDDWTTTEELLMPDEKQIVIQDEAKCIEKKSATQKKTYAEKNESSKILRNGTRTHTTKQWSELDGKQNYIQDKAECVEFMSETQKNTFTEENVSSKIVCNGALKGYITIHTGEKNFKCKYCSYICSASSDLKKHIIRRHAEEKPFKCEYCDYTCSISYHLKIHLRTHTGEKPFKCQYCSHKFSTSYALKCHIRTHTGDKPYKCEYCNYTSKNGSDLNKHLRRHTGDKPYKCEYCNYTSSASSDLKKHIRTHTGEKPFKCEYCSYTCSISPHLKLHLRTHTGEKPFKCEYCSYTCISSSTLKYHIRTHTREKPYK